MMHERQSAFYELVHQINNDFSDELNLYHIVCGHVFDGKFFDYISKKGLVSTSKIHPSGLNYLIIVYEQCPELDQFSDQLLCSYNRFTYENRALQSFGDANGDRIDFFRFARQREKNKVPKALKNIEKLWDSLPIIDRKNILKEVQRLYETGSCDSLCLQLLTAFQYVKDGEICVPVYLQKHDPIIDAIEHLTEDCVYEEMEAALSMQKVISSLTCSQFGVAQKDIANELYHILFGQLNEQLVATGFVASPTFVPGEGRYLKSIQLMQ